MEPKKDDSGHPAEQDADYKAEEEHQLLIKQKTEEYEVALKNEMEKVKDRDI